MTPIRAIPIRIDEESALAMKNWLKERAALFAEQDINRIDVFYSDDYPSDAITNIDYLKQVGSCIDSRRCLFNFAGFLEGSLIQEIVGRMLDSDSFFTGQEGNEGVIRMFPNGYQLYGTTEPIIELAHRERITSWNDLPVEVF